MSGALLAMLPERDPRAALLRAYHRDESCSLVEIPDLTAVEGTAVEGTAVEGQPLDDTVIIA